MNAERVGAPDAEKCRARSERVLRIPLPVRRAGDHRVRGEKDK